MTLPEANRQLFGAVYTGDLADAKAALNARADRRVTAV